MDKFLIGVPLFLAGIVQTMAGTTNSIVFVHAAIPTLDEIGLTVLTVVVAIAGGVAARRRKKK